MFFVFKLVVILLLVVVRKQSVSTYTSILAGLLNKLNLNVSSKDLAYGQGALPPGHFLYYRALSSL